jgi:hypothetical protein
MFLPMVADYITYCIENKTPVSFLKFGDGEFQCVTGCNGGNCDADPYTKSLSEGIKSSFSYLSQQPNTLFGAWHTPEVVNFWESIVENSPKWVNYHTLIVDIEDLRKRDNGEFDKKMKLLRTIKTSPLPKIIICNELLQKTKLLFGGGEADVTTVFVPLRDWFDTKFNEIFGQIKAECERANGQAILIFSAGMGSKVLVYELYKLFPQNIYLDFGSALDIICTRQDSRGRGYGYGNLYEAIRRAGGVLPEDAVWHDPKYNPIYESASRNLGIHMK